MNLRVIKWRGPQLSSPVPLGNLAPPRLSPLPHLSFVLTNAILFYTCLLLRRSFNWPGTHPCLLCPCEEDVAQKCQLLAPSS